MGKDSSIERKKTDLQDEIINISLTPFFKAMCRKYGIEAGNPFLTRESKVSICFRGYGNFMVWTTEICRFQEDLVNVPTLLKNKRDVLDAVNFRRLFEDVEEVLLYGGDTLLK